MIKLSVHLITYNNEKHIKETIQSILKQKTGFKYEIVIGDDCSTDSTLKIINQYKKSHPHLFHVKKNETQLGILKNFKATLDRCQGKYVFDIAGDDILHNSNALQIMVDTFENHPKVSFTDCGYDKLDELKNTKHSFSNEKYITCNAKNYKTYILLGKIAPVGHCFKRDDLYKYVDFDTYLNMNITIEDYPIIVDLVMHTDFYRINKSLVTYRVHDNSYSHKRTFESHFFLKNQMRTLFNYFSNKYNFSSDIKEKFYSNFYKELLFFAGYFEKRELGKDVFKKLKSKSIKDYIHYWSSQNKLFRKLVSIL